MTMLQHSFASSSSSSSSPSNEDVADSRRRSPESVLYESPRLDLLQREELSPEIVSKTSRVKLKPKDAHEDDDAEEIGKKVAARNIERSESELFETRQMDLLLCHEQLSPEVAFKFSKIKEPNRENDVRKVALLKKIR